MSLRKGRKYALNCTEKLRRHLIRFVLYSSTCTLQPRIQQNKSNIFLLIKNTIRVLLNIQMIQNGIAALLKT